MSQTAARTPAPFFARVTAFLIDVGLITLVSFVLELPLPEDSSNVSSTVLQIVVSLFELVLTFGYFGYAHSRYGTTLGKKLFRLEVIKESDGERLKLWRANARALCLVFSGILGVGFLMALFNPRKQALHDVLTGTRVIRTPKART